jgi:hypothetical protein
MLMLQECSPRPRTLAYWVHVLRATTRHQGLILAPLALGATTAIACAPAVPLDLPGVLVAQFLAGAIVAAGARVWMRPLHARASLWLDAHPQNQGAIAAGYRLPERPAYAEPFVILGEVHPERCYRASGDYTLAHTTARRWSATPEWQVLPAPGLVTGTIVFGATGSGKTAYVLRPAYLQIFHHPSKPGGLVMDSKAALSRPLVEEMRAAGRIEDIRAIGPHCAARWNPLYQPDATPEALADSVMTVAENIRRARLDGEAYWIRAGACSMAAGAIGILRALRPADEYFTVKDLMALLSRLAQATAGSDHPAADAGAFIDALAGGDEKILARREWRAYRGLLVQRFGEDEKFRAIYLSELASVLQPLLSPRVENLYSPPSPEEIDFPDWKTCINEGYVAVLECNASAEPGLSSVLGMFLKLSYQNAMLARVSPENESTYDQERYMLLCIDEYQDYISPGDSDFLAKCRQSRSISAFFTQGWPSLCERVDEKIALVVLQNCRNIFVLTQATPDENFSKIIFGDAERTRRDVSTVEHTEGARLSAAGKFEGATTVAQSHTDRTSREGLVPPEVLKNLPLGQGVFVGHDGYEAMPARRVYAIPYYREGWRAADVERAEMERAQPQGGAR